MGSTTVTDADAYFNISAWSHDYAFTDQDVQIAFDNFVVNQGELVCPPPDSDGDGIPDDQDACPGTPAGEAVDASGCGCSQKTCGESDGNICNGSETCYLSTVDCLPGIPLPQGSPCEADDDLCTNDHCDGSGTCVFLDDVVCQPPDLRLPEVISLRSDATDCRTPERTMAEEGAVVKAPTVIRRTAVYEG
jgi:hypothetical protein